VIEEQHLPLLIPEYNALRGEVVARTGHLFQIAGFSITALTIWAAEETSTKTWLALVAIVLMLSVSSTMTLRGITRAKRRIREIEQRAC